MKCYHSRVFWTKMILLLSAVIFHFTVHRSAIAENSRVNGKFAGGLSLLLWIATAAAAKWVEFA
jgi:fatty acid desaturase